MDGAGPPVNHASPLSIPRRSRSRATSLLATMATLALLLVGSGPASAAEAPDASFGVFPTDPVSGQDVRLVSYACDPDGLLAEHAWDLNGDGIFGESTSRQVGLSFATGSHTVSLRATDQAGLASVRSRVIDVAPAPPEYVLPRPFEFNPPLLSPSSVIRLAGQVMKRGARIRLLTVRAPVCSRATLRCRGRSRPVRRVTRVVGRKPIRFRAIEGKRLRAGVRLEVLVSKRDRVGKYTRFRIRRNRAPARFDTCLRFGDQTGSACPAG